MVRIGNVSLSKYKTFEVDDVVNNTNKTFEFDVTGLLTEQIRNKLREKGYASMHRSETRRNVLLIKSYLLNFEHGSAFKRWLAPGAGKSMIIVKSVLVDKGTHQTLGTIVITEAVTSGGLFSIGADKKLIEIASTGIVNEIDARVKGSKHEEKYKRNTSTGSHYTTITQDLVPYIDYTQFHTTNKSIYINNSKENIESIVVGIKIDTTSFTSALIETLKKSTIFHDVASNAHADYELRAKIVSQKILPGLKANAFLLVHYELIATTSRKRVWEETILSQYETYGGNLKDGMSGAARKNIEELLFNLYRIVTH